MTLIMNNTKSDYIGDWPVDGKSCWVGWSLTS